MLKILVVDDSHVLARAIANVLCEHSVTIERDCTIALAHVVDAEVDGQPYDLVVCNSELHSRSAIDALALARALEHPPMLILIAGEADLADSGADAMLVKPFAPQELRALVTCLVAARATRKTRPLRRTLA